MSHNKGVYVLCINNNRINPLFYVGRTNDIVHRIKQIADGEGASCITGESFIQINPIITAGIFT